MKLSAWAAASAYLLGTAGAFRFGGNPERQRSAPPPGRSHNADKNPALVCIRAEVYNLKDLLLTCNNREVASTVEQEVCSRQMNRLSRVVNDAATQECSDDSIATELEPIMENFMESPLARRMLTWPRGYVGDFETIECLMQVSATAAVEGKSVGHAGVLINQFLLDHPLAQQHRNKVACQAQMMLECIQTKSAAKSKAHILSLACGGCPDVRSIQHSIQTEDFHFTFFDQDVDALTFTKSSLQSLIDKGKCRFVEGNVLRIHRKGNVAVCPPQESEGYDLVVAGGVFDYLSDKMIERLLRHVWQNLLASGGTVFFTNICPGHNNLLNIKQMFNWSLLERNERQLMCICQNAGIPESFVSTRRDETGLAIMVSITKP